MIKRTIVLTCSEPTFMVIHKLLENIRLGGNNVFEEAISALMANNYDEAQELYNELIDEYGEPSIGFEYSDSEGMVINITED